MKAQLKQVSALVGFLVLALGVSNSAALAGSLGSIIPSILNETLPQVILDRNGRQLPPSAADSDQVDWEILTQKDSGNLNGVGLLALNGAACSGALLDVKGAPGRPAYFLTAAHCLQHPFFLDRRPLIASPLVDARVLFNVYRDVIDSKKTIYQVGVVGVGYAIQDNQDIAILQLNASLDDLVELGIHPLALANETAKKGTLVKAVGIPMRGIAPDHQVLRASRCDILGYTAKNVRISLVEKYHFDRLYRMNCSILSGNSGGPLLTRLSNRIVGIVSMQGPFHNYATDATIAHGCFDDEGILNLTLAGCRLPKDPPAEEVK